MSWQDELKKVLNTATSQGTSRYDDEWIKEIIHDQDVELQDLKIEFNKRFEQIEKTQRKIIKELEKKRVPDRSPNRSKKSVPPIADSPVPPPLSHSYKYEVKLTNPKETWRKIPRVSGKAGELSAIVSGLDNLNKQDTSWFFMVQSEHENIWLINTKDGFRLDSQSGIDTDKFKHSIHHPRRVKFKEGFHLVNISWYNSRVRILIKNSKNKIVYSIAKGFVPFQSKIKHFAIGNQAMSYGRRANVGDNIMVHKAVLGLE